MRATVAICTRNRAEQLRRVLDSACALDVPAGMPWELIIVDNGSSDHTAVVVDSYQDRLPVRLVEEPTPGLSHARNRAVAEAAGDYICWTDDDVVIDRSWLAAYLEAFDRHLDCSFFGGLIQPVLEGDPPEWFVSGRRLLASVLAERDLGPEPVRLVEDGHQLPYGANYAVRTRDQRAHPYDPALGVSPLQRRLGEETAVFVALLRNGGSGVWVPGAKVQHIIPPSRQSLDYVRVYQEAMGETWAYQAQLVQSGPANASLGSAHRLLGAPVWIWRAAALNWSKYLLARRSSADRWLPYWLDYGYYRGAALYCMRAAKANAEAAASR